MYVTPHFDSSEWDQPARYGLPVEPYPDKWVALRLIHLCNILEELRYHLLCPIRIISGYRSPEYNRRHIAAGHKAAQNSMHIHGVAADIVAPQYAARDIHDCLLRLHNEGTIRIGGLGEYQNFVHVDVRYLIKGGDLARWKG